MTYCLSDIHGEYELFMRLLEKIKYSDSDNLIICGDVIDKGRASVRLAKTIFDMPNAQFIMGNHEYMFFKFYNSLMQSESCDYDAVLRRLQQYFPEDGDLLDWDTTDRLSELPYYIEESDFVCVHAGVPLDSHGRLVPLDEVSPEELVYDRRFKQPEVLPKDSKCVFFGHTPTTYIQSNPVILAYPKRGRDRNSTSISDYCKVHLDTGASSYGVLGCFCTDTCQMFYVKK